MDVLGVWVVFVGSGWCWCTGMGMEGMKMYDGDTNGKGQCIKQNDEWDKVSLGGRGDLRLGGPKP